MIQHTPTDPRIAMRRALGAAGAPWLESLAASFAVVGGHPDSGFGLVVVDPGNPRHRRGTATYRVVAPI